MVRASIAISMGIACPSAHERGRMRREDRPTRQKCKGGHKGQNGPMWKKEKPTEKANVVRLSLDLALERDLADWVADGQGEALDRREPAASAHDEHEERINGKPGRTHTTTMSSKVLEMAARRPRSNISNDSGCIKVLAITDSGTAESVAQIGRECVADQRSTRPPSVAFHHGSAFGGPRLSHGTLVCFSPAFIASRVVNRPLVSSARWSSIAWSRTSSTTLSCAHHARADNSLVKLVHSDTAWRTRLWRKHSMSGATCVMEGATSARSRRRLPRRTPARSAAHARAGDHHLSV